MRAPAENFRSTGYETSSQNCASAPNGHNVPMEGEIEMPFSEDQVMLTLAALSYRGFQDLLNGTIHEQLVRDALIDGLETFKPVQDQWEIMWGPATTRQVPLKMFRLLAVFDSNSMFVVRHRTIRNKY